MSDTTIRRGDTVRVHEPGIEPWQGSVRTIKPPVAENRKGQKLDQWADVRRLDGIEYKVPVSYLEVLDTLEDLKEDTSYWDMAEGGPF